MAHQEGRGGDQLGTPYSLPVDDAQLARRAATGERAAWGEIYDRYADRLHDYCFSILRDRHESADALHEAFLTASTKIGQLRDPERLRPWLYAICRTQALAMVRHRSRETPSESVSDMAELIPMSSAADGAEVQELRQLVWEAAGGLTPRDRSVLDLHLRHGLEGKELGEALGINPHNATVLLARVREHVERSLGALLVGRLGRRDCPQLDMLLADWDGSLTPLLRKRIARHIDGCGACGERRRRTVSPLALLSGVPMLPAPLELREPILDGVVLRSYNQALAGDDTVPTSEYAGYGAYGGGYGGGDDDPDDYTAYEDAEETGARQWLVPAAGVLAALLVIGALALVVARPDRELAGLPATSGPLPAAPLITASSTSGQPSTTTPVTATTSTTTTTSRRTTTTTTTTFRGDDRAPEITSVSADRLSINFTGNECRTSEVTARVVDDSSVDVVLVWQTASGTNQTEMSTRGRDRYRGTIGPVPTMSDIQWWVEATDSGGATSKSPSQTLAVVPTC